MRPKPPRGMPNLYRHGRHASACSEVAAGSPTRRAPRIKGAAAMFYDARKKDHGLARDPFKAIVVPRPIGWFTSISARGEINLAPYSFFNAVSEDPPMVMFSSDGRKDSVCFIEETQEFVCNFASYDLRDAVSKSGTGYPRGINEMIETGLEPAPSRLVRPPRVAVAPCALECKLLQIVN